MCVPKLHRTVRFCVGVVSLKEATECSKYLSWVAASDRPKAAFRYLSIFCGATATISQKIKILLGFTQRAIK
jgi:hypothetical protein